MQEYFVELSKYFIVALMAFYTFFCFLVFRFREETRRRGMYTGQRILLFLIQLCCFFTLYFESGQIEYLFFYAFVQIFLFSAMVLTCQIYERINRLLLNNMCLLLGIGFVLLSRLSLKRAEKQLAIVIVSFIVSLFVPMLITKMKFLRKLTWLYASVGIFLLSAVLLLGNLTHGSKISFSIADITVQPSEFVKLIFVFFLAAALFEDVSFKRVAITTVIAALHVIILVVSRDLGSALIFFICYLFVVFMATASYLYLLLGLFAGSAGAVAAYFLFGHVKERVVAWLNPFAYIDSQGYQITQSLFAIGSGSWFGMGLMGGTPGDIPYVEKDFVFSALCEELGVISGICIILICLSCFIMMMHTGLKHRDTFYRLIALGCGVIYIFQIFLTIGGGIKFIPLTGVTLPFISYGGSSVFTTTLLFFIVQGVCNLQQPQEEKMKRYPKKQQGGEMYAAKTRKKKRSED